MFSTSKLVRRNTQGVIEKHEKKEELDPTVAAEVIGKVTRGECQLINRVLLASTAIAGNLDAVPHACTVAAEGDAPKTHRASWMFGFLARRATQSAHAIKYPDGHDPVQSHPEEHITGGEITRGECDVLAKHLATTFGTLGLLPKACAAYLQMP